MRKILCCMKQKKKLKLIHLYLVEYNLLFNGKIASVFKPNRGTRQGDPLSPYLYIISANVLSCLIFQQESQQEWKGIKLCRTAHLISHLLYADDSLLFTEASQKGFNVVKGVLNQYTEWSGQVINFQKSCITFTPNVSHQDKLHLSNLKNMSFSVNHTSILTMTMRKKCIDWSIEQ